MNADRDTIENRLLVAFAEVPSEGGAAIRDARVAAAIRTARSRAPRNVSAGATSRVWVGTAAAFLLVAAGAGAWWASGLPATGPGPAASLASASLVSPSPDRVTPSSAVQPGCGPVRWDDVPVWPDQTDPPRVSTAADQERIADLPELTEDAALAAGFMAGVPDRVGDLTLVGFAGRGGRVLAYFTAGAFAREMTRAEFMRAGGSIVSQSIPGRADIADIVLQETGDRARAVTLGWVEGVMVHGDPVSEGLRPYGLWWADARGEWSLTSTADPASVLALARAIACSAGLDAPVPGTDPSDEPSIIASPSPSASARQPQR